MFERGVVMVKVGLLVVGMQLGRLARYLSTGRKWAAGTPRRGRRSRTSAEGPAGTPAWAPAGTPAWGPAGTSGEALAGTLAWEPRKIEKSSKMLRKAFFEYLHMNF